MGCEVYIFPQTFPDILHPLTTVSWEPAQRDLPDHNGVFAAVLLWDKIFVALATPYSPDPQHPQSQLCCTSVDLAAWTRLAEFDILEFGLGTYRSQLVRVGGVRLNSISPSSASLAEERAVYDDLLVSEDGVSWHASLPPMPTKRYNPTVVSCGWKTEYLVVVGGIGSSMYTLNVVEVLADDDRWWTIQSLPIPCRVANHCFHNRNLFLTLAPYRPFLGSTIFCELETLVAHCTGAATGDEPGGGLWKIIAKDRDVGFTMYRKYWPDQFSGFFASLGGYLVTSKVKPWPSLYAHSPLTRTWVTVEEIPALLDKVSVIVPLPATGDLVLFSVFSRKVVKATLRGTYAVK